ncbi:hypothetical protein LIER_14486 [Lithospermum erythrorhizon]|uniref:Bifunctional inhibitor/plant lipid transfer protein/seed storage helical domain-containing protein n=1 Tax=Lithospermum erythrorhizon TaxID=34254 RepID=A0AAV3PZB4_LITER
MTKNITNIATFFTILLPFWTLSSASAKSQAAPSPAVDCTTLVVNNMVDCLAFVSAESTTNKPQGTCCNGLKNVMKTHAQCLCKGFKNTAKFGLALNVTKALALPSACHVSTASVTNCGSFFPMASSPSAFADGPTTSMGGSEVAPTHAPSLAVDCTTLVVNNLVDCLSFVGPGSTTNKPEGTCCNGLKNVLKTNAQCLCQTFKNSGNFGIALNVTKALALPSICHISAPSVTNCGPFSPMASSPSAFVGAPPTSISGSEVAPAQALGSSGSLAVSVSAGLLVPSFVAAASLNLIQY